MAKLFDFLRKNGERSAFGLGVVLVLIFLFTGIMPASGVAKESLYEASFFDFGIGIAIVLAVICAAMLLLFGIAHIAMNIKTSWKGLAGFIAVILLMVVFYNTASGDPNEHATISGAIAKYMEGAEGRTISEGNLKWIGSAARMGVVMIGLAFVSLIVMPLISPIINRVK